MPVDTDATTFVLIHGAWHGGWCWSRVTERLTDAPDVLTALLLTPALTTRTPL
ncbi:hypothetical protein [Pectobacterium polaris]|uniref:hypothetical protein n=1 Tax=Pectobacterium polaris TaxID=2042057 RepID=UPI001F078D4B|nr:hypothetical protein [Pectobacterium polaris]